MFIDKPILKEKKAEKIRQASMVSNEDKTSPRSGSVKKQDMSGTIRSNRSNISEPRNAAVYKEAQ